MSSNTSERRKRVVAISSGGGHWVELLRVRDAFAAHDVTWVTVREAYRKDVPGEAFHVIPDATRWSKLALVRCAAKIAWLLLWKRPDVVVSTRRGAPGYFGLRLGKLLGAKTVWIDSIANVEELSLSGQKIGKHADLWLTQWEHLAGVQGSGLSRSGAVSGRSIFVTVGAQMPFDRLVLAVDAWAHARGRTDEVFAQIGEDGRAPEHIGWTRFLEPDEFRSRMDDAERARRSRGDGVDLQRARDRQADPRVATPRGARRDAQTTTRSRRPSASLSSGTCGSRGTSTRSPPNSTRSSISKRACVSRAARPTS